MVEGEGFEPSKAEPADLQSAPFDRSGTPPTKLAMIAISVPVVKRIACVCRSAQPQAALPLESCHKVLSRKNKQGAMTLTRCDRIGTVQSDSLSGFLSDGSAVQSAVATGSRLTYAAPGVCRSRSVFMIFGRHSE